MDVVAATNNYDERTWSTLSHGRAATSWGAILAGTVVAAASSLLLFALGLGLGFSSAAPGHFASSSATSITVAAAVWLIVVQWISAGLGGYIAGRLRTRWIGTHTHEVFFRDTAHGFVTWAAATVLVIAVGGEIVGAVGRTTSAAITAVARPVEMPLTNYATDRLLRPESPQAVVSAEQRAEIRVIIEHDLTLERVPDADTQYLAALTVQRTGVGLPEAQRRVAELIQSAQQEKERLKAAAANAEKNAAKLSILTALSMLVGAFIACVSAALGGRLRDEQI